MSGSLTLLSLLLDELQLVGPLTPVLMWLVNLKVELKSMLYDKLLEKCHVSKTIENVL